MDDRSLLFGSRVPRAACQGPGLALFTICLKDRTPHFQTAATVSQALEQLTRTLRENIAWAPAYCFMPDHLHVLAQGIHELSDVWLAMVQFKRATGAGVGGAPRVLWQAGFDTRFLQPGVAVEAAARYVLNNPVRSRLVGAWQEYLFSGTIEIERWGVVGPRRSRRGTSRL